MKTSVKVEGLRELDDALGHMLEGTAKNVLRRSGRFGLEVFDEDWRKRAPFETGDLQDSGGVGSKLTRRQRKAHERASFVEVFAGPGPNPQAVQQEFGNEHNPPQPFVRPAWEANKDDVLARVVRFLGAELKRVADRAARKRARAAKTIGG